MSATPLTDRRKKLNKLLASLDSSIDRVKDERRAVKKAKTRYQHAVEAQQVLQTVAQKVQERAHKRIAAIVTRCLESIFDDPYTFRIEFEKKRGKTEANLVFMKGKEDVDPDAVGGGVLDVAAFGLRVACLMLSHPRQRRLIVMDEPFKWVHNPVWRERVRGLIEALAKEMEIQFIFSTGISEYQVGQVIRL